MNDCSNVLLIFKRGSSFYLLHRGEQRIRELVYSWSSLGLEDGLATGEDFGTFRLRDLEPHTYVEIHQMSDEEIIYAPLVSWSELSILTAELADGTRLQPCRLKSVERFGGYRPDATFSSQQPAALAPPPGASPLAAE